MDIDFWAQFIAAVITIIGAAFSALALKGRIVKAMCVAVFIVLGVVWVLLLRSQSAAARSTAAQLNKNISRVTDLQGQLNNSQQELMKVQQVNNALQQQLINASTVTA